MVYLCNILISRHFSRNGRSIFGLGLLQSIPYILFFWILNSALTTKYDLNSKHVVRQCDDSSFAKFKMVWNNFIFWRSILTINQLFSVFLQFFWYGELTINIWWFVFTDFKISNIWIWNILVLMSQFLLSRPDIQKVLVHF